MNRNKAIEKELLKEKLHSIRYWWLTLLIIAFIGLLSVGMIPMSTYEMTGIVTGKQTLSNEEGHKFFLIVKLDENARTVKVRLPKNLAIKVDAKVVVRKSETLLFGATTYGLKSISSKPLRLQLAVK